MPTLVPNRFLVRITHPCPYVKDAPRDADDEAAHLVDLPVGGRLQTFAALDDHRDFADVRLGWNELGLAVQATVAGKRREPAGDADRPWAADGLTLWLDTRGDRNSHRASRFCHQFHLLPSGAGPDKDEPTFSQTKINRATQDAPLCRPDEVAFRCHRGKGGYRIEAFLPAAVLTGFDPEQHPKFGAYYHVRDAELGDQFLAVSADFPFADDPSLWEVLELVK